MEKWLFSPFTFIAGWTALLIGYFMIIVTAFIGYHYSIHFDGPLSVHKGLEIPFYFYLIEGNIAWLSTSISCYIFGVILSRSAIRIIDVLGTIALARAPILLTSLGTLPWLKPMIPTSMYFMPLYFLYMLPLIWIVILYYNAYSISCNLKGLKLIGSFIAGVCIAEIISKITVIQFYKLLL